ncbi:MAG: site-specific integrase [Parabacteroides distasonis]|nr:site-specific integrase [Parabacteroides distasonis]
MEKILYNVVFNRTKKLNAEGKAVVQVEAYLNKQKRYFSTKIYVKPNQWDNERRRIVRHPNKDELNQYIADFISDLERKELTFIRKGYPLSLSLLKMKNGCLPDSFISFMRREIPKSHLKASTLKNHYSTLQLIEQYKPNLLFEEVSFDFLCDFEDYLLGIGYHRNTIAKHMKHLKRYINLAINKELFSLDKYPFRKYRLKYVETQKESLTPEELERLELLAPTLHGVIRKILDMFLFCCYTGLRFSDATMIKVDDFHFIDDRLWLIYTAIKTDVNIRLPLFLLFEGKAISIYRQYCERGYDTLFGIPMTANSYVNRMLKRVGMLSCIEKRITFHTARHTNATLLLYNGANITTVQKLLGHKSVKTTEIYSNIMDMTLVRDLKNIQIKFKP